MNSHLTNGQQKLLLRLASYPSLAWKSCLAFVINLIFFCVTGAVADDKLGHFYSAPIVALNFLMGTVLFVAAIWTFLYSRGRRLGGDYREIKRIAQREAETNPRAAYAVREDTPEGYCECFGLDYEKAKSRTTLWLVLPLVIMFVMHGINMFEGTASYKESVSKVTETQQAIIAAFGEDYEVDYITDPAEDYDYYTYHVEMCRKDDPNASVDFSVRRSGEITYQDYNFKFDPNLSTDENMVNALVWFAEIETIAPKLSERFEEPKLAEFTYNMSDKFMGDIYDSVAKGSTEYIRNDYDQGHYHVYENCSMYSNPSITINVYYYR